MEDNLKRLASDGNDLRMRTGKEKAL